MTEQFTDERLPSLLASTSPSRSVVTLWIYATKEAMDWPYFVRPLFLPVVPLFDIPVESRVVLPVASIAFAEVFAKYIPW